ncbi:HAD family acid phosphatase [Dermatophilaceae bacterium Sec6.4]
MPESPAPLSSRRWCAARRITVIAVVATVLPALGMATANASSPIGAKSVAPGAPGSAQPDLRQLHRNIDRTLSPRTQFTMAPDGSSGLTQGGAGIPNIDSVKSTVRTYYNAENGIANKTSSPYISEMNALMARETAKLPRLLTQAKKTGKKPAVVFDADDTTLWTYDMEDAGMHFNFDPALQDVYVQEQRFPAVPAIVAFEKKAKAMGFTIFGLSGRNDDQKTATVANLNKVGYRGFTANRTFTKWTGKGASQQPSYIACVTVKCTTVEFKAGTRAHIESLGYNIALNLGDQWSDLQGGHASNYLKVPNPTYYLPSPDLPGLSEPKLAPRSHFRMKADGSSGRTAGGEGIPNVDSTKSTIRTYYGTDATGIANKVTSPYISEITRLTRSISPILNAACGVSRFVGIRPAIVLDVDDTTLSTYDMEDAAMHFNFDPALQDVYVQGQKFPATPGMVALANAATRSGCTIIGLTGRNDDQKAATLGNLSKVGYTGFTSANLYTKWTGKGASQQPSYIKCATAKCSTIEFKSQTRAFKQTSAGGRYTILANFGDQFSDLIGGSAVVPVKLPNPTYYLP